MISSPEYSIIIDQVVYLDNWRNKRFVIWTLAIPLALFGYFVPYVHLVGFIIVFFFIKHRSDHSFVLCSYLHQMSLMVYIFL